MNFKRLLYSNFGSLAARRFIFVISFDFFNDLTCEDTQSELLER